MHAHAHPDPLGSPPFLAGPGAARESSLLGQLRELIAESNRLGDDAAKRLALSLATIIEDTGDRLYAQIDAEGDDAAVRRAILNLREEQLLDMLRASGLDKAHAQIFGEGSKAGAYDAILDNSEELLKAAGVRRVDAILDGEAFNAALKVRLGLAEKLFWDKHVERLLPEKIWEETRRAARLDSLDDVIARGVAAGEGLIPQIRTQALTDMAAFDRWTHAEAIEAADPDGDLLLCYMGPDDKYERPFCDTLNGHAFSRDEFLAANNWQVGHPIDYCGGYRCRHRLTAAAPSDIADLGVRRGTSALVKLASDRAQAARKKGKGGRR